MSVEELDRIAAGLPEWEGSPAPVAGGSPEDVFLREQEAKLRLLNRTERVLWILVIALAAGVAVAGYVHSVMGPPSPPEFLREKP